MAVIKIKSDSEEMIMGGKAYNGKRILRSDVENLVAEFAEYVKIPVSIMTICGSYRRGKPDCGDIEIVILANGIMREFEYRDLIATVFGRCKWGSPKMSGEFKGVQFDLFISNHETHGAMLLHTTGSGAFNVTMRKLAIKYGLKLNQYGLFHMNGLRAVCGYDEVDYFNRLGVKYVQPEER